MIRFKKGVKLERDGKAVKPRTIVAMSIACDIWNEYGYTDERNTVTSVMDGKHSANSLHYEGDAFDQRTWQDLKGTQMPYSMKCILAEKLRERLGAEWDVVIESTHLHIELDKKDE